MKGRVFFLSLFILNECFSCRNSSNKTAGFIFPRGDSIPAVESVKLSPEAISDISENITSPVEIANLLQKMGVPFSPEYIVLSLDPGKQITEFDKALALGILGADLGYMNVYEKTGASIDILSAIKDLAEGIKVGQFFDFGTIKRLSIDKSDPDSLLFLSTGSYSQIDNYLRDDGRGQLSALIIIGAWIEGQYLATQIVKQYPDARLRDRIGEQKLILNDLLLLAEPYCNHDPEFKDFYRKLRDIKDKYKDVRITYTLNDPVSIEKNGALVITQTETSNVEMTEEQLTGIAGAIKNIRNELILNN